MEQEQPHSTGSHAGSDLRARAKQALLREVQKGSAMEPEKAKQCLWEGSRSSGVGVVWQQEHPPIHTLARGSMMAREEQGKREGSHPAWRWEGLT